MPPLPRRIHPPTPINCHHPLHPIAHPSIIAQCERLPRREPRPAKTQSFRQTVSAVQQRQPNPGQQHHPPARLRRRYVASLGRSVAEDVGESNIAGAVQIKANVLHLIPSRTCEQLPQRQTQRRTSSPHRLSLFKAGPTRNPSRPLSVPQSVLLAAAKK